MLSAVLLLLPDVDAGTPFDWTEVKVMLVVVVEGEDGLGVGASVVALCAGVGRSRGAEERKALKTLVHV